MRIFGIFLFLNEDQNIFNFRGWSNIGPVGQIFPEIVGKFAFIGG